jgi:FkbM family methyltransferase
VGIASKVMSRVPVRVLVPSIAWQYRLYEPELARLEEFVPKDRGAVDIGVWWGPWTWWLSRRVPTVDSFEANLDLVSRLTTAMPANVNLHPVALSDRAGEATLWVPSGGLGTEGRGSLELGDRPPSAWRQQSIATSRLDDFKLKNVGFVKIDVEGHELPVLEGAVDLIDRERPTVMVEIEQHFDRHGPLDTIKEFFADHAYGGEFLQKGRWHPIEELDRQAMSKMATSVAQHGYAANRLLYSHRYVHNFVFKPD